MNNLIKHIISLKMVMTFFLGFALMFMSYSKEAEEDISKEIEVEFVLADHDMDAEEDQELVFLKTTPQILSVIKSDEVKSTKNLFFNASDIKYYLLYHQFLLFD